MLIPQQRFNLSDIELEFQVNDRRTFKEFTAFNITDSLPDSTTVAFFREGLHKAGLIKEPLERCIQFPRDLCMEAKGGQINDATIIPVPIQRNSRKKTRPDPHPQPGGSEDQPLIEAASRLPGTPERRLGRCSPELPASCVKVAALPRASLRRTMSPWTMRPWGSWPWTLRPWTSAHRGLLALLRSTLVAVAALLLGTVGPAPALAMIHAHPDTSTATGVVRSLETLRDLDYRSWQLVAYREGPVGGPLRLRVVGYPGRVRLDHPTPLLVSGGRRLWELADVTLASPKLVNDGRDAAAEFDLAPLLADLTNNRPLRLELPGVFTELPVPPYVVTEWRQLPDWRDKAS